jgi:hypothetical protein
MGKRLVGGKMSLKNKSLKELKEIAAEKGINVNGLKKADVVDALERDAQLDAKGILMRKPVEAEEPAPEENVITYDPKEQKGQKSKSNPNMAYDGNNAMVSKGAGHSVPTGPAPKRPANVNNKIALFLGNSVSSKAGKFPSGYNFVTREVANKLMRYPFVRLASPEEVARHYGVKK